MFAKEVKGTQSTMTNKSATAKCVIDMFVPAHSSHLKVVVQPTKLPFITFAITPTTRINAYAKLKLIVHLQPSLRYLSSKISLFKQMTRIRTFHWKTISSLSIL